MVPDFPLIFATYFYRGKSRELIFCCLVDDVYEGWRWLTRIQNGLGISLESVTLWTELSMGDNGCRWENLAQQRISVGQA